MKFYSTKNKNHKVDLKTAVLQSLPPDNGLYMPERIDVLPTSFFDSLSDLSFQELSYRVASNIIGEDIDESALRGIVDRAINFSAPIVPITDDIFCLELWHGPSLAFKDFGARFMAELMSYLVKDDQQELSILVATSGDTGGAVAAGFNGVERIDVTILYPKGKVSPLQELQLTTWGGNIKALEIDGTFDDCQALVKQAFLDKDVIAQRNLSSANSINIARLIPQSFYYFEAYKQIKDKSKKIVFSVPSGNFGNLTAGLFAKKMGLPFHHMLAGTNVNNIVPYYLATGEYVPRKSVQTVSNAMDVGNPSNFQRMLDLFEGDWKKMFDAIEGYYYSDEEVKQAIKDIAETFDYIADPHGAIGYLSLEQYLSTHPDTQGIFLETAHPAKFLPVMEPVLGKIDIPEGLSQLRNKTKISKEMSTNYADFKSYLVETA